MVYMAKQERPVRRKVAIEIIKLGMDKAAPSFERGGRLLGEVPLRAQNRL